MQLPALGGSDLSQQAAYTHEAIARLTRRLRTLKLEDGLTHERLSALGTILANVSISISQLAAAEGVRVATTSRMVSGLEELGLANRLTDKADRRGVLVVATSKGKRAYERAVVQTFGQVLSMISELDAEQLTAVRSLLKNCR